MLDVGSSLPVAATSRIAAFLRARSVCLGNMVSHRLAFCFACLYHALSSSGWGGGFLDDQKTNIRDCDRRKHLGAVKTSSSPPDRREGGGKAGDSTDGTDRVRAKSLYAMN